MSCKTPKEACYKSWPSPITVVRAGERIDDIACCVLYLTGLRWCRPGVVAAGAAPPPRPGAAARSSPPPPRRPRPDPPDPVALVTFVRVHASGKTRGLPHWESTAPETAVRVSAKEARAFLSHQRPAGLPRWLLGADAIDATACGLADSSLGAAPHYSRSDGRHPARVLLCL